MKSSIGVLFVSTLLVASVAVTAEDLPTIKQVYETAHAGRLDDALKMMARVLEAQPNSAKAHFVEAELLAEQRRYPQAKNEFETAERLDPQLSFAKSEAVQKLKAALGTIHTTAVAPPRASPESSFPWMTLLIVGGVIGIVAMIIGAMRRRSPQPTYSNGQMVPHSGVGPMTPQGMPMSNPNVAPGGSGLGSSVMTGLATGAAVGVGIVAGEALAHHFMDGDRANVAHAASPPVDTASAQPYDMGGNDFGVTDNSQWNNDDVGSISDSSNNDWS